MNVAQKSAATREPELAINPTEWRDLLSVSVIESNETGRMIATRH